LPCGSGFESPKILAEECFPEFSVEALVESGLRRVSLRSMTGESCHVYSASPRLPLLAPADEWGHRMTVM
jgi:hypothetical protein